MDNDSAPLSAALSASSPLSALNVMSSTVSPSFSQSSASAAEGSLDSVSSWHGLSPSANEPEALQALDLAAQCFQAGRFYKSERLCLRSLRLHRTAQAEQLLLQIYAHIPQQTQSQTPQRSAAPLSAAAASAPTAAASSAPAASSSSPSAPPSPSWWCSAASAVLSLSRSPPPWLCIPRRHRRPLLFLWSLVAATAFLRFTGFFAAFDHSAYAAQQQQAAVFGRAAGSRAGGGFVDPNWLLGLTNLFPLVLMLLFATGQWQRRQQQQQQQQH